jgi:hypothetical protein
MLVNDEGWTLWRPNEFHSTMWAYDRVFPMRGWRNWSLFLTDFNNTELWSIFFCLIWDNGEFFKPNRRYHFLTDARWMRKLWHWVSERYLVMLSIIVWSISALISGRERWLAWFQRNNIGNILVSLKADTYLDLHFENSSESLCLLTNTIRQFWFVADSQLFFKNNSDNFIPLWVYSTIGCSLSNWSSK